ncbi:hypothetical protein DB347_15265 [Opitutaceae bacterium EW11]|nr:hypothetical protein DB347_15265 [Opitutaceae bacterium EW11]
MLRAVFRAVTAPAARRRFAYGAAVVAALLLVGVFVWRRPGTLRRLTGTAVARLEIVNLCDRTWSIAAAKPGSRPSEPWTIPPKETRTWELPEGEYAFVQALVGPDDKPESTRTFSMQLSADETYRWKLVTLLTDDSGGRSAP